MPAIALTLGGIFLPDTPNSLVQRGKPEEGRKVLVRIRGVEDVDEELEDIKAAVKQSESVLSRLSSLQSSVNSLASAVHAMVLISSWDAVSAAYFPIYNHLFSA